MCIACSHVHSMTRLDDAHGRKDISPAIAYKNAAWY
jgi:hypothetical protein